MNPMTISIALKVGDGVVLGTDSASALVGEDGHPHKIYASAEKLLNLVPGLPVGVLAFGVGALENRSVLRLARDLRGEMMSTGSRSWLDPARYRMEDVAARLWEFFRPRYRAAFAELGEGPEMGFVLAGYSVDSRGAEIWSLQISGRDQEPRRLFGPGDRAGLYWEGDGVALSRLLHGADPELYRRLFTLGAAPELVRSTLDDALRPLWHPEMPIPEAIDLVRYLAEVVTGFARFSSGPAIVVPPIDMAAITAHEGFRWIHRKRWFDPALNLRATGSPAIQEAIR